MTSLQATTSKAQLPQQRQPLLSQAEAQREVGKTKSEASKSSTNLASLIVCALSILSICQTAFNLYLFAWLYSNVTSTTTTTTTNATQQQMHAGKSLLSRLEVRLRRLEDEDGVAYLSGGERILLRKAAQIASLRGKPSGGGGGAGSTLRLSSKMSVDFGNAQNQSAAASLIVSPTSLQFPHGLIVTDRQLSNDNPPSLPFIECSKLLIVDNSEERRLASASARPTCRVSAKSIRLTSKRGVDFARVKSVQANVVRSPRLHSALQRLQLMSGGAAANFVALDDEIHLQALGALSIGRRNAQNSTVSRLCLD